MADLIFASLAVFLIQVLCFVSGQTTDPLTGITPGCNHFYNETDPTLVLESPGFEDGMYPNNQKCAWIIESPEQAAGITIRFTSFDLEPTKRCSKYDYVMLYAQGNGESAWNQLGTDTGYCGQHDSINITETTKRILIVFRSDGTRAFKGFTATFNIQITQAKPRITCLSTLENTKEGGSCDRDITVEEYQTFLIQCVTRAIPPAKYAWERRFNATHWQAIRPDIVKNIFPNGSIQFHMVRVFDHGDYRCFAENKHGDDAETFTLKIDEKCLCPKNIITSWYQYPPYTKFQSGSDHNHNAVYKGIFYAVLAKMFQSVCGNCQGGHGESTIVWDDPRNLRKTLNNVKKEIEDSAADVYFPIEGGKLDDKYRNIFYFLPMVDSPGVAFMVPGIEEGASAMAIFDSVLQGKPILILTVIMAVLAGIIMWMLDTYWNEEQFPRKFFDGIGEGFWWAFVTMTTVGYGDIAPVGVPGRLFAVIWILTGLVIIAIFTGVITTSLTVVALSSNVKLYGTNVGAMNNTAEYRMGVVKNAKMTATSTFEELSMKLSQRTVEGALLDSYVAAYHRDKFSQFRVNNIFTSLKSFGIVLGPKLSSKLLYTKFQEYIEKQKAAITMDIEGNTETLSEPSQSAAEEASSDLFNPSSKLFVSSMMVSCIMLIVLTCAGLLFEYGYLRPRHRMIEAAKNLEMIESVEVKDMARRAKILKEILLREVKMFYSNWSDKLGDMTRKHKAEQKKLLQKGPAAGGSRRMTPPAEEAIEMDNTDSVDAPPKLPSRPSTAASSHKSTTSLIKSDDDDDDNKDGGQAPSAPAKSTTSLKSVAPAKSTTSLFSVAPAPEAAKSTVSLQPDTAQADAISMGGSQISVKPLIGNDQETSEV